MPPAVEAPQRRRRRLAALSLVVLLGHLWLADGVLPSRLGEGDAAERRIQRIDVAFVRELQPSEPEAVAPLRKPRARRAAAPAAAVAAAPPASSASQPASAPALAAAEPPTPLPAAQAGEPGPGLAAASAAILAASAPALVASAPASAPAVADAVLAQASAPPASSAAAAFEWPPSTRLSYTLSGNYRGPVEGQARVEWLRSGTRYQVMMEASIGPSFAPLMTRRVSSEGEITAEGLSPRRYEEETHVVMREPRRIRITLDADRVRLANGRELPRPEGVQDSASQFVHLTWLFTTQPAWLTPGRSIELPLALPRHVLPWTYDVLDAQTLHTPAGPVRAVHVKPRRQPSVDGRPTGDLTAEMWVAPSLQYLPVRIIVRQDELTYIDMLIERLPQQAAAPNPNPTAGANHDR